MEITHNVIIIKLQIRTLFLVVFLAMALAPKNIYIYSVPRACRKVKVFFKELFFAV